MEINRIRKSVGNQFLRMMYLILPVIAGSWVGVSCTDYLDVQPYGRTIPKTAEEFSALVHGQLDDLDEGTSYLVIGTDRYEYDCGCGDNFEVGLTEKSGSLLAVSQSLSAVSISSTSMWDRLYEVIRDCNIDIDNDGSFDTEISENDITETYEVEETVVEEVKEEEIFAVVEEEPAFPGGENALYEFLDKNLVYPRPARDAGIEGVVMVEFVVEPNGKLSHVSAIRKVAPSLDEEAIRVVKMMPAWSPGKQRGKAVRTYFRLPINFQLSN